MADTKKKYYKISQRETKKQGIKHYIIIDDDVKPTAADLKDIKTYIECGYEIKHKSQARAKKARERALKTGFGKKKEENK